MFSAGFRVTRLGRQATLLALLVAALWGCSDQSANLLSPQDVLYSHSDPECPRDIEEETGEAAANCKYRGADYERVRNEVNSYVSFHHPTCIDAWQRAQELMNGGTVYSLRPHVVRLVGREAERYRQDLGPQLPLGHGRVSQQFLRNAVT